MSACASTERNLSIGIEDDLAGLLPTLGALADSGVQDITLIGWPEGEESTRETLAEAIHARTVGLRILAFPNCQYGDASYLHARIRDTVPTELRGREGAPPLPWDSDEQRSGYAYLLVDEATDPEALLATAIAARRLGFEPVLLEDLPPPVPLELLDEPARFEPERDE